jgi:uncharacterized protein YndB with AHSA1/START domain
LTTKKLNLTRQIEAPLSYVFYLFNNKSGWSEWFSVKTYGYAMKDAVMRVYHETDGDFLFHFTAEEPEERIAFDLTEMKSQEASKVEVSFSEEDDQVTISLVHSELPAERVEFFEKLWGKGLDNLKSVAESGKDLRTWERPFLGVLVELWITEELAEEKSLPTTHGMQLSGVIEGRGAEQAGLQKDDIIVRIADVELHNFNQFLEMLADMKAGDVVDLAYYRGDERHEIELTLSSYPVAEPPATAHDYAEKIEKFHGSVMKSLDALQEEFNEAQFDFRPGAGEWSAKETIAHLISTEADAQVWVSTLVAGCEEYICGSSHAVRIKSLLALYPTAEQLLDLLARRQRETVALIEELPAEFVSRKGSFARLATHLNLDLSKHYKEHIHQIKESLAQAENVRVS